YIPYSQNRGLYFIQVEKGFKNEKVHSSVEQGLRLFPKDDSSLFDRSFSPRLDANSEWSKGSTDEDRSVRCDPGRLAGYTSALNVDFTRLFRQTMGHQLGPIAAESVRLEDVRSGFDIIKVDLTHEFRIREIELIE